MAVKLRLLRMGAKKKPFYRIVAADSRTKRDGKYIELVGTYNPLVNPAELKINEEVALKWLSLGAKPTDTVKSLFTKVGINEKHHLATHQKQEKPAKETKTETKKSAPKKTTTKKTATKKTEKESK